MTTPDAPRTSPLALAAWLLVVAVVGLSWIFPDAPSRLRALWQPVATMRVDCALQDGPCAARFDDGTEVTLSVTPAHAPAVTPLTFEVEVRGDGVPSTLRLMSLEMYMGEVQADLTPHDHRPGTWIGRATLPLCTAERMLWRADVTLEHRLAVFEMWSTRP